MWNYCGERAILYSRADDETEEQRLSSDPSWPRMPGNEEVNNEVVWTTQIGGQRASEM